MEPVKLKWKSKVRFEPPYYDKVMLREARREAVEEALGWVTEWLKSNVRVPVQDYVADRMGLEIVPDPPKCKWCGLTHEGECPPVELVAGDRASRRHAPKKIGEVKRGECGNLLLWVKAEGGCGHDWEVNAIGAPEYYRRHNPGDPPDGRRCK